MSDEEYSAWYDEHAWDPSGFTSLTIETDLAPAEWLEPLLVARSFEVWMSAPRGYESYVRIFFPFVRTGFDEAGEWHEQHVRWTDIARENGRTVHALMEQETIGGGRTHGDQVMDNLSSGQLEALMPILARHTSSVHGWFLLWEGFGDLNEKVFHGQVPRVSHEARNLYLLRGPIDSYAHFTNGPNFWWPDDRAWCMSTDTDFAWSYLAGSRACVDEVLAAPIMDAVETRPENPARSGMDVLNDPDGIIPRSP